MSAPAFFLDFCVFPILAIACLGVAWWGLGFPRALGLAATGYASWTLLEYLVHRFALHHIAWFRSLHDAHHAEPHAYIGTPTLVSVAIFYALGYAPADMLFGRWFACGWMAGLLAGYFSYVVAHWAVHHISSSDWRLLRRLKRQHAGHHHVSQKTNFGVTTGFWDRVFGTQAPQPRPR